MKLAHYQDSAVQQRLANRGVPASLDEARTLRKAEKTLHRWAEQECGDENDYASWAIERDETTGKPYLCIYPHAGKNRRTLIPDREAGALRRVATVCEALGAYFYHQGDPRGCALYWTCDRLAEVFAPTKATAYATCPPERREVA